MVVEELVLTDYNMVMGCYSSCPHRHFWQLSTIVSSTMRLTLYRVRH